MHSAAKVHRLQRRLAPGSFISCSTWRIYRLMFFSNRPSNCTFQKQCVYICTRGAMTRGQEAGGLERDKVERSGKQSCLTCASQKVNLENVFLLTEICKPVQSKYCLSLMAQSWRVGRTRRRCHAFYSGIDPNEGVSLSLSLVLYPSVQCWIRRRLSWMLVYIGQL